MDPIHSRLLGLGLIINDGDVDVLLSTGSEEQPVHVHLSREGAVQIGASLMALASEALVLQERLEAMSPEELQEYLTDVQRRNARGLN